MDRVIYAPTSELATLAALDRDFISSIKPAELTYGFTRNAGLPVKPEDRQLFINSWEDPLKAGLSGEFTGKALKVYVCLLIEHLLKPCIDGDLDVRSSIKDVEMKQAMAPSTSP